MLTYEQCCEIRDHYNNFQFFERVEYNDGYKICIFNYRLIQHAEFETPIPGRDLKAYEMRGITFVFDHDGTYRRFLAIPKFFNINQTEMTLLSNIQNKTIVSVNEKMDGSMISFIILPNNKVVAKTIGATESEQAVGANRIINDDPELLRIITECLNNNVQIMFEYISPKNRIVLHYEKTELVLIRLRDMNTGKMLRYDEAPVDISYLKKAETIDISLSDMLDEAETLADYEGWVITFEDMMCKQKTKWYFELHMMLTSHIYREDYIIENVVNETIDDYLSQIPETEYEIRAWIDDISKIVVSYIQDTYNEVLSLIEETKRVGDREMISRNGRVSPELLYALHYIRYNKDVLTMIKEDIIKYTYFLDKARYFLEHKKLNRG
jgi:T4 RnlA family RNA ligase